jgi:hypothetical protein
MNYSHGILIGRRQMERVNLISKNMRRRYEKREKKICVIFDDLKLLVDW